MLGRWFDSGRPPIGIDFGAKCVRAVQVQWAGERWKVTAAGARALPAGTATEGDALHEAQVEALKAILGSAGFKGRRGVSCLPASIVQYKNLRLPPMPSNELRTAVEFEAADRLKLGKNFQIQFYDAGEVRQGEELREEIILVAAPAEQVERHTAALVACGLEPEVIDVAPSGLARCAMHAEAADPEQTKLVVDVGATASNVLISRQSRVMFFKRIELGGNHFENAIANGVGGSPADAAISLAARATAGAEASDSVIGSTRRENVDQAVADALRPVFTELAREVSLCLRYHSVTFRGHRPQHALLVGGSASDPLLSQVLAQESGLAVKPADLGGAFDWSRVDEATRAAHPASTWAIALGMALCDEHLAARKGAA